MRSPIPTPGVTNDRPRTTNLVIDRLSFITLHYSYYLCQLFPENSFTDSFNLKSLENMFISDI